MYKISVIVPTFKPEDFFYTCINSVKDQTLPKSDYELIIVLNGPKDPFFKEISDYLNLNFKNINYRLLYNSEAAISAARNRGLDEANAPYITFIDDDDYISEGFLEDAMNLAEDACLVVSNVRSFISHTDKTVDNYLTKCFIKNYNKPKASLFRMRHHYSICTAKVIPLNSINPKRFNHDFDNGEDSLFMADISCNIKKIKLTSVDTLYNKRIRYGSLSNNSAKLSSIISNAFLAEIEFLKIHLSAPLKYNLLFFLTRYLAVFKGVIARYKRKTHLRPIIKSQ